MHANLTFMFTLLMACAPALHAADPTDPASLERTYQSEFQPLLKKYCYECHSADLAEAEVNFAAIASWSDVRKHASTWQKAREMLDSGQMPPPEATQPSDADRTQLRHWVRQYLGWEAKSRAGDPGRVVLRRLNNAEYTYTVRDLAGVSQLDPTREFPVDGAAGEGFTNTGNALVISPALVTKYLDAAKEVAEHAVLLPDGFRFSSGTTPRDWTNEILDQIRGFYGQFTGAEGGDRVNLQGIVFDTNQGGRLPVEKYIAAAIAERDALLAGTKTIAEVAAQRSLNAKYLGTLWQVLATNQPSLLLGPLRDRWRIANEQDASALAAYIAAWQKGLWRFTTVGHIGKVGGPKRWLEPVNPLTTKQDLRLKIPAVKDEKEILLSLVITDAGDGDSHDFVVLQKPRLVVAGRPDVLLRDISPPPLEPSRFGKHPDGTASDNDSLCVKAPAVIEIRLPAEVATGCEFVSSAVLDSRTSVDGSVQLELVVGKPSASTGLVPSEVKVTNAAGQWTADNQRVSYAKPILVHEMSSVRPRFESAFDEFRQLFPGALCYTKIVPVDEVVTLTLYYREDDHLARLMLDEAQRQSLDRLWDELHFVSQDAPALVDALEQLIQYATQDADPKVFEPLRKPTQERADAFHKRLIEVQPLQIDALLKFAEQIYRRPLDASELAEIRGLYDRLRQQEIPHEEAFRLTLARMFVAPAFLYRIEKPRPGKTQTRVSPWELASRLSYFLWSSQPDEELRQVTAAGRLDEPEILIAQTRRMLRDEKVRRLSTEFACQWLQIYDFENLDEKSEKHFPQFTKLRGAMYEESIRFFTDLFQNNGSVQDVLAADHTFLNPTLAQHYGIPLPAATAVAWQRVDGLKQYGRGGVLAHASALAKQSGASRTSPILRGNWISEVLLGERLPKPPKGVPPLPDDESMTNGLTVRQLVQRHTRDPKCSVCHQRIDPFGFALEKFDAIGRLRDKDLGDRPIETQVTTMDGAQFDGLDGLRNYLLTTRRDAFVKQFSRKLLGYALGRAVQLSDEPLLDEMQMSLKSSEYKMHGLIEAIVLSPQFRDIRGRDLAEDE